MQQIWMELCRFGRNTKDLDENTADMDRVWAELSRSGHISAGLNSANQHRNRAVSPGSDVVPTTSIPVPSPLVCGDLLDRFLELANLFGQLGYLARRGPVRLLPDLYVL